MSNDWSPFLAFVRRHDHFLVTTHTRPDGDALGCQLAIAAGLESLGKKVERVIPSPMPPRYQFLDPERIITAFTEPTAAMQRCDAILVVDTGTFNQLAGVGEFIKKSKSAKFVIDHHRTQDDLGGDRLVDVNAEACGRLVFEALTELHVSLTPEIANQLFAAVATDTGWFRHTNTTPDTFALASELMAAGARVSETYELIYETSTLPRLRLLGHALDRLDQTPDGRVTWTEIHVKDFPDTGAVPMDTEDLINYPRGLAGCMVAMVFIEQKDGGVKVSFRSKAPVDVAKLAEQFAGGGHQRAAGATITGTLAEVRDRVVAAAVAVLPH